MDRFHAHLPRLFGDISLLAAASIVCVLMQACSHQTGPDEVDQESYEHVRASWSPDGGSIAFNGTVGGARGIYIVDTSGQNVRLVLAGEGIGVTWSPDGQWLAFSRLQTVYKIRTVGDSLTRLTVTSGAIRPAWSPSGDSIVFVRGDLWMLDLRTLAETELLGAGDYPSWYADGKRVMFLSTNGTTEGDFVYQFDAYDLATGVASTQYAMRSPASCGYCSINPMGNAVVFSLKSFGKLAQVWKADIGTGAGQQLTGDGGDYPAWSPDGLRIVYTRTQGGDGALWIMNADGSGKRRLTEPG